MGVVTLRLTVLGEYGVEAFVLNYLPLIHIVVLMELRIRQRLFVMADFDPCVRIFNTANLFAFQWFRSVIFVDEIEHIVKTQRQIFGQLVHLLPSKCTV